VDSEVHVPSNVTPQKVLEAIRRALRQHDLPKGEKRRLLNLVQATRGGPHRLPQALLSKVTETYHRYGVPFSVVDRRAMVSCPALRSQLTLSADEERAMRQLLLRDSGVLISGERTRDVLAVGLAARRQQRTLVAALEPAPWVERFSAGLGLAAPHVAPIADATADTWITVASYDALARLEPEALRNDYGMVICDGLCTVDAVTLMRTVRGIGARYLLGLAAEPVRKDGLHQTLFLALGGVVHRVAGRAKQTNPGLRLTTRGRTTDFAFPGYEGRRQYQALVAALAADRPRGEIVAADVAEEAGAGHPCLVLSERRDHLELLDSLLPEGLTRETITSTVRPAERQRIISRFERGELAVLLATSQIAAESLATPKVQRLFFTFPFSYARKLDRVIRRGLLAPTAGQDDAALYDYDDPQVEPLHRAFVKRAEFLGKLRREIERAAQLELPLG
jgi:hypothetical protein